jgi:adenylate cyclase
VGPQASAALLQAALKAENANLPSERRMEFRFGVNLGVMVEAEQIHSDGVNVAARLESLAAPAWDSASMESAQKYDLQSA